MYEEIIQPERGSKLRKNGNKALKITFDSEDLRDIFIINHTKFFTKNLHSSNFIIKPNKCYMIINKKPEKLKANYSEDISSHEIIYNPYKYEHSKKEKFNPLLFAEENSVPEGYIDVLTKWYSIKFTYLNHNLIYVKPEMGLSIQIHSQRSEKWDVLTGKPIVINGNSVWYYVDNRSTFFNGIKTYHSIINPNKNPKAYVVIKEEWSGNFDEEDIVRVYNPNNYS